MRSNKKFHTGMDRLKSRLIMILVGLITAGLQLLLMINEMKSILFFFGNSFNLPLNS